MCHRAENVSGIIGKDAGAAAPEELVNCGAVGLMSTDTIWRESWMGRLDPLVGNLYKIIHQ